jgi:hypothetical protein
MASDQQFDSLVLQARKLTGEKFDEVVDMLVGMLSALQTDEDVKMDYVLSYIALMRVDDDFPSAKSAQAYSNTLVAYQNRVGVTERNEYRYTTTLMHATHTDDASAIEEIIGRKKDLSYMDQFPGCLRDLVKRNALKDSSIKMGNVAATYPEVLVVILRRQLNYHDLADLAMSQDERLMRFRNAIFLHLVTTCKGMNGTEGTKVTGISFSLYPDLSVVLLANEMCKKHPQSFLMFYDDAYELVELLTGIKPNNASLVAALVKYTTSTLNFYLKEGGMRFATFQYVENPTPEQKANNVILKREDLPRGKNGLPLPLVFADEAGNTFVQSFKLRLAEEWTYRPTKA